MKDLVITSLETITAFDPVTDAFMFMLDELQSGSIAQGEETTDITGKQGRLLSRLKRNKTFTVNANNGMVSGGLLAAQTGGDVENKATEVLWSDYLTVASGTATTSGKAIGTAGAEIISLNLKNADGSLGTELEQAASAAAGKFAYDPTSKELSFHTDVADGTEIVVYYKRRITADVVGSDLDKFSKKAKIYMDCFAEDKCGEVFRVQIYCPKADISGEFSMDLGDNQTVHAFSAEALAGACDANGNLWTYTVFGASAEDAE